MPNIVYHRKRTPDVLRDDFDVFREAVFARIREALGEKVATEAVVTLAEDLCLDKDGKEQPYVEIRSSDTEGPTSPAALSNLLGDVLEAFGLDAEEAVIDGFREKSKLDGGTRGERLHTLCANLGIQPPCYSRQ
jgi:hypothetical protein